MKIDISLESKIQSASPLRQFKITQREDGVFELYARPVTSQRQADYHLLEWSNNLILLCRIMRQKVKGDFYDVKEQQRKAGNRNFFGCR